MKTQRNLVACILQRISIEWIDKIASNQAMAYSLALRQRIVEAVECGGSTKRAIGLFGVHKTFIDRLPRQRRECDDLAPLPQSDVVSPKLTQADLPLHYDLVAAAPAATLAKRSQQLKKQARIALRNAPH